MFTEHPSKHNAERIMFISPEWERDLSVTNYPVRRLFEELQKNC
jgi:hypothetical protein